MAEEIQYQDFQNLGLLSPMTPDPTGLIVQGKVDIQFQRQIVFYPTGFTPSSEQSSVF